MNEKYLNYLRKVSGLSCNRCGKEVMAFELEELKERYSSRMITHICEDCLKESNKILLNERFEFSDREEILRRYLSSGDKSVFTIRIEWDKLNQAGYY